MTEQWRPVVGFPDCAVSDFGRIRSPYNLLKASVDGLGYLTVKLTHESGARKTVAVHCAVAAAFLGPRPAGKEVRHLDGDRANPSLDNLAYGTRRENRLDAYRHGRCSREKDLVIGQRTQATKDARYGRENWPELQRAGISYSRLYDL